MRREFQGWGRTRAKIMETGDGVQWKKATLAGQENICREVMWNKTAEGGWD